MAGILALLCAVFSRVSTLIFPPEEDVARDFLSTRALIELPFGKPANVAPQFRIGAGI